ncbi:LarC family nickel insertion protein [Collinsella tanakaei]|uniref:LarC family nickel insertion protein n=1 Tax=Collinsella tanakaei TaxID=626935 RepID=UPI00315AD64F
MARIIDATDMTEGARALAHKTFDILAAAEAKAHAVPLDKVHFHEVGAIDSIVDIVATSVLLDSLHIARAIVPVLVDGHGTIRCQHGIIPVPAPATLNVCTACGLPLRQADVEGELVTPTGAALVAALDPAFTLPERYLVRTVGIGAGKRTYERPSLLRALLIDELPGDAPAVRPSADMTPAQVVKLECDIDDSTSEVLAYAAEALREAGAREVHWLPIFTKKGRPAYQLQVIASPEDVERLELIIFRETSTIGIRRVAMDRTVLARGLERVETPWGEVTLKCVTLPDGTERCAPEYDECAAIARAAQVPLQQVMDAARAAALGK